MCTAFQGEDMDVLIVAVAVALLAGGVGWIMGGRRAASVFRTQLGRLQQELDGGILLAPGPNDLPEVGALRRALGAAWAHRPEGGEPGSAEAALRRVGAYLRRTVANPLSRGLAGDEEELRRRTRTALDAVDDLVFHSEVIPVTDRAHENVTECVQQVMREFAQEFETPVRLTAPPQPVEAPLDPEAFKDALYMLLVNAGRFGGGSQAVEVGIEPRGGDVVVVVRDRGVGFSADALARATEPFYSTEAGSLGLGLTHVRQVILAHGGELTLRNRDEGGGEVEIILPLS
jgi:signal transduction histidine kinase